MTPKTTNVSVFDPNIKTVSKAKKWDPFSSKYVFKTPAKKTDVRNNEYSNVKNPVFRAMKELSLVHVRTPSKTHKKTKSLEKRKKFTKLSNISTMASTLENFNS